MSSKWWLACVVALFFAGAWYFFAAEKAAAPTAPAAPAQQTAPQLSPDLYPLFGGVNWGVPWAESALIGTSTFAGASIRSATTTDTADPAGVFMPFLNYYDQKLKALGWQVANDLAAGGHTGGVTGYRKAGGVILVSYRVVYHVVPADAPSECPCDVVLSLFSTAE